jgi:hypothetical protein
MVRNSEIRKIGINQEYQRSIATKFFNRKIENEVCGEGNSSTVKAA